MSMSGVCCGCTARRTHARTSHQRTPGPSRRTSETEKSDSKNTSEVMPNTPISPSHSLNWTHGLIATHTYTHLHAGKVDAAERLHQYLVALQDKKAKSSTAPPPPDTQDDTQQQQQQDAACDDDEGLNQPLERKKASKKELDVITHQMKGMREALIKAHPWSLLAGLGQGSSRGGGKGKAAANAHVTQMEQLRDQLLTFEKLLLNSKTSATDLPTDRPHTQTDRQTDTKQHNTRPCLCCVCVLEQVVRGCVECGQEVAGALP